MELPARFPFQVSILHNGRTCNPLVDEERASVLFYDPDYDKREMFKKEYEDRLLNQFSMFLHKYPVLKAILQKRIKPKNTTLLSIIEDAFKQSMSDLDTIMFGFLGFLDYCKNKFPILFKKEAQYPLIETLIRGEPKREQEYKIRKVEIDQKREVVFSAFTAKGFPSEQAFSKLKGRVNSIREIVKKYRDNIAAHDGKQKPVVLWEELDEAAKQFQEITDALYITGSFHMAFGQAVGPGFNQAETKKLLLKKIF